MLRKLTVEQREAVTYSGNLLITACPGSGKTRVLTHKVAFELDNLSNPKQYVVALTFTNRATDEIKERIDKLNINTEQLWAGTIHSFCLDWIIKPYAGYHKLLKNGFNIADTAFTDNLMRKYKNDFGYRYFDQINTRFDKSGKFEARGKSEILLLQQFYRELTSIKLLNFDLILYLSYSLLNRNSFIVDNLSSIFEIICVDEYQDTQELQYAILHKIFKVGKTRFFYVGDINQAIYGTLGGIAKTKQQIEDETNCQLNHQELKGNWRSHQRIINYYINFQVQPNDIKALNVIWNNEKGKIKYFKNVSKDNLIEFISRLIIEEINKHVPYNEICVLAPQWQLITALGRKLKTLLPDVPFDAYGLSPFRRNRDNFWYKLTRLFLTEPQPNFYLTRLRWAKEVIAEIEDLFQLNLNDEFSQPRLLLKNINNIKPKHENGLEYLEAAFKCLMESMQINILDYTALFQQWNIFFDGTKESLLDKNNNYADDVESFKKLFKPRTGVVIETCHGIKGEEFDTVIAFGLLRGKLPHWDNIINCIDKGLEDAKKLLYVISSRARKNLYLISETGRLTNTKKMYLPTEQLENLDFDYDE